MSSLFLVAGNDLQGVSTKMSGKRSRPARAGASSSTRRVERKTMEKDRRNKMKNLYSMLNSLVPNNNEDPKETKSLPDQIDEAARYIKCLEAMVNEAKKKKERLVAGKRSLDSTMNYCSPSTSTSTNTLDTFISPKVDIQVRGSTLEVTLISGKGSQFIFSEAIRVLHEEGAQVLNANFSAAGSSIYYLVHAEISRETEAAAITERLKVLASGSSSNDRHQRPQEQHFWDFDISPNIWEFDMFHAWHSA